jgi:trehalose/maltose hydrolase-like predicted phosphorylase
VALGATTRRGDEPASVDHGRGVLDSTFAALVFDWDGTAVADRGADAGGLRELILDLCGAGVHVFIVSGTHVGNVDGQLAARPTGPGSLFMCLNRGSEVFEVDTAGPRLVYRYDAGSEENQALDRAAALCVAALADRGLVTRVVSERLNRRKIDVIPLPEWADPPKARIDELLVAVTERLHDAEVGSLGDAVDVAMASAERAGIGAPRVTSDVKHVEIGLTDKADSARWAAAWLADRGITGNLVLVAGDEFGAVGGVAGSDSLMIVPELERAVFVSVGVEPTGAPAPVHDLHGGPARFVEILRTQLQRHRDGRVPSIDLDPAWVVTLPHTRRLARAAETLGTLANGRTGTRAACEEDGPGTAPLFVVGGIYDGEAETLLPGPSWDAIHIKVDRRGDRRFLDMRTGVLLREGRLDSVRSMRFASIATPAALALRAEGIVVDGVDHRSGTMRFDCRQTSAGGGIAVGSRDHEADLSDGRTTVERLAAWAADSTHVPQLADVALHLAQLEEQGFDRLLAEHRRAWAARWRDADVDIEGNEHDALSARFAVFHLLANVADEGEAAVGARGLSGDAYGGHVFWDSEVFVLPALVAVNPAAARAMLAYRVRRLDAAKRAAVDGGFSGARYPWESAAAGIDVTPREGRDRDGAIVPILTGDCELHITADIAWAAVLYDAWTGDGWLESEGRDLVLETARYWASRVEFDGDGRGHITRAIGPDEYHEMVDDNAFTNVMARFNLRAAADLAERIGVGGDEPARWRAIAETIVDGYDCAARVYEQFRGYFGLEPLLVESVGTPPLSADVVLGRERTQGSQIAKQPDVLMLHHMVPDEVVPGSLRPNIDFYLPRIAHGSSLSPAICAALLARDGRPDDALPLFRLAARLDLEDTTNTTAGGLHMATLGGTWQALAFGFLGLRALPDALEIDPRLPSAWDALRMTVHYRGTRVVVRATHGEVTVETDGIVSVRVAGGDSTSCGRRPVTFDLPSDRSTP